MTISMTWLRFHFVSDSTKTLFGALIDDVAIIPDGVTDINRDLVQYKNVDCWSLEQNYPNPFNPTTTITYDLARTAHVQLTIYDVLGRQVKRLVDKQKPTGQYNAIWDGTNDMGERAAAGLYFCRIKTEDYAQSIKLVLAK